MKKVFFRLFFSIIAITLVILAIQVVIMTIMMNRTEKAWQRDAYNTFKENVTTMVEGTSVPDFWTISAFEENVPQLADDRITALVFYDTWGKPSRTLRRTSEGLAVYSETTPAWVPSHSSEAVGAFELITPGTVVGSVEVYTHTPATYKNTSSLLNTYIRVFLITIPIGFVIALALGAIISKRNAKDTKIISQALATLSEGNYGVDLPEHPRKDQAEIIASIKTLDKKLSDHEASRQAWLIGISHDLNTPVTSMKMLLESMQEGVIPADKLTLQKLIAENNILNKTIQSVIVFSRLQTPDYKVSIEEVHTNSFVEDLLMNDSRRSRIEVHVLSPILRTDPALLKLALRELLDNALHATEKSIILTIAEQTIEVVNEGTLPENASELFEPWSKGDRSRATSGSGLGLSIVGQVMKLHHGKATINQEGRLVVANLTW